MTAKHRPEDFKAPAASQTRRGDRSRAAVPSVFSSATFVVVIGGWLLAVLSLIGGSACCVSALSTASSAASQSPGSAAGAAGPVLVVGATGKVGRRVVQKLLARSVPVRALVRSPRKAAEVLGTSEGYEYPPLEIVVADLGRYEDYEGVLDRAVEGCSAIVSVSGAVRFSRLADFLPWRMFRIDPTGWADREHPYFANYRAQQVLIRLAEKHSIRRFVRLTGLGLAYSPFGPFAILFNGLLSFTNRYGLLCEQALAGSTVPYVVLRPGGLAELERNASSVNVQVDASGKLPFPGRIGRSDVAELAVQSALYLGTLTNQSYTLACRWCGDDIKPKPQGSMADGHPTAREALKALVESGAVSPPPPSRMKPYGAAVALVVYPLAYFVLKCLGWLASGAAQFVLGGR
jgi:hypothetical protein